MGCPKSRFPIWIIVFDELKLILFVSQGLTLSTASLVGDNNHRVFNYFARVLYHFPQIPFIYKFLVKFKIANMIRQSSGLIFCQTRTAASILGLAALARFLG